MEEMMEELIFNKEQKEILMEILKLNIDDKYNGSLIKQAYHDFKKTDKHFITPKWSCAFSNDISHFLFFNLREEYNLDEDYILQNAIGNYKPKPKLSKKYELTKDLEERIREPYNNNKTMMIVFKN